MAVDGGDGREPVVRLPVAGQPRPGAVDESRYNYEHPVYQSIESTPGLSIATASLDELLTWGLKSSIWVFPMATSCCGIELMAAAASRVDLDRMGTIVRATPRQADVMVVAGTITVKMAPRVKKLWEQMPEPKWCIAMGSCAISGDFYRELYSVIPGIDTVIPVDVYIPGCPPNPEALMHGLLRLKDKVAAQREGKFVAPPLDPSKLAVTRPSVSRYVDADRDPAVSREQADIAMAVTARDLLVVREREQASQQALHQAAAEDAAAAAEGLSDEGTADEGEGAAPVAAAGPDQAAEFADHLKARFGIETLPSDGPPLIPRERHLELARWLVGRGYKLLVHVVASHWPAGRGRAGAVADEPEHFEVAYGLRTLGAGSRTATWSLRLLPGESAPSLVGLLVAADWQEREQWDLVGVPFEGHPDLRRIMLPEGWEGHPLRRDYPADAHVAPWR